MRGNQTMKVGQLIEYNMRKSFSWKIIHSIRWRSYSWPFHKKPKLSISLDQQFQMLEFVFIVCPSRSLPKYIKTMVLTTWFYLIKLIWKTKRGLDLVSLPHLLYDFWRKYFFTLYFINWPNFTAWLPLTFEIMGSMYIEIIFV